MAAAPPYHSEGSNCTSRSIARDELSCLMKTSLCQELKGLISEFEAKAVFHCQESIDQVFGSFAKRADDKLNIRTQPTFKSYTPQKGPIIHQSMFALEASFAESALLVPTKKRRPSLGNSSSNPTSLHASQMIVGRPSLKHNAITSNNSVVHEQSSGNMRVKVIDERGMAKLASSSTDEVPHCTSQTFDTEPSGKQARSDTSWRPEEAAVLAQPSRGKMFAAEDSKREIEPPNFVAEEELKHMNSGRSGKPGSQSDGLSMQAVPSDLSDGNRFKDVLPMYRSEDEVAFTPHRTRVSTLSWIFSCRTSSSRPSASQRKDSPVDVGRRTSSVTVSESQRKDGFVDANRQYLSSPIKSSSKSSSSSGSAKIEVANLDSLQRNLNERLTRPTSPETLQEVLPAPKLLPHVDDELALEDKCESSSDSEHGSDSDVGVRPPFLLRALGISPLSAVGAFNVYHARIVILLILACIADSVMAMLVAQRSNNRDRVVLEISSLILSVGTLFCHVALWPLKRNNSEMLGFRNSMLGIYAQHMNFRLVWQRTSMSQEVFATIIWSFGVVLRFVGGFQEGRPFWIEALHNGCLAFIMSVFVGNMLCLLHITNGLVLLVDSYCCHLVHDEYRSATLFTLTTEWNKLQALLRRASAAMTPCMILAQIIAVANIMTFGWSLLLGVFEVDSPSRLSLIWPAFGCMLLVAAHLVRAAQVTGRCSRVPAFINSHCEEKNVLRSQLVEYTQNSAAGFYVYEVKLTAATVMKMAYVIGIGSLTAITRLTLLAGL